MPLIVPQRGILRNPLAYPAGIAPGFDPTHVAAKGISAGRGFSGVSLGGNFISLLNDARGTIVGSPTAVIDGTIGPATNCVASAWVQFAGQSTAVDASATIGVIYTPTSVGSTQFLFESGGTNNTGWGIFQNPQIVLIAGSVNTQDVIDTTAQVAGVPYFVGVSMSGNSTLNAVIVNLQTWVIRSKSAALAFTSVAGNGTYEVGGNTAFATASLAKISAVMYAPSFMSMSQLLAWASDPWSFWYPRKQTYSYFSPPAAPTTAAVRRYVPYRNPLAYPAGVAPGFDPRHVAAGLGTDGRGISLVATGGGRFINPRTGSGTPTSWSGTPLTNILSIGPSVSFTAASDVISYPVPNGSANLPLTMAAVVQFNAVGGSYQAIVNRDPNANGLLALNAAGTVVVYNSGDNMSNFTPTANRPYFIGFSSAPGAGVFSFAITDLTTGKVTPANGTLGSAIPLTSQPTCLIGNNASQPTNGGIAAAMFASIYLSPAQLLQWASDPWSFWYPRPINLSSWMATTGGAGPALTPWFPYSSYPDYLQARRAVIDSVTGQVIIPPAIPVISQMNSASWRKYETNSY